MILKIIRWLRGYVLFEITGRFPERFINLSTRQGCFVFSAKPYPDKIIAAMLLSDYRNIRPVARNASVRLRVRERHGLPFIISRYKSRVGLAVGALLFLIIAVLMQSFVWSIEINGITTISESALTKTLSDEGLYCGAFKGVIDLNTLQRNIMKEVEEIGWMSVNIIGTKAEVEIKEKELKPHILEADVPCNIKAECDGIILSMNTKYGTAVISPGSAVIKGSLLVSGVTENPSGEVHFVHADAEVIARTQKNSVYTVKKSGECKLPQEVIKRYKVNLFWLEFPVTFESVSGDFTSRIETENCCLNSTLMPFGLITEHCTAFVTVPYEIDSITAEAILRSEDYLYRLFALSECESINAETFITETKDEYILSVLYDCTEDIAAAENFIVN